MPLAAALVYWNALAGEFVWDDRFLIVDNPRVQSLARLPELLGNDYVFVAETELAYGYFRPVSSLSLAIDWAIWGANPFGFHLTNLILHAAASLLVCWLALGLGLGRGVAWAGGLLFAVHPIHAESVAWIAGRTDVLAFLGAGASLALFLRAEARREAGLGDRGARAGSLVLFALALAAKEMAAVVPLWIGYLIAREASPATPVLRLRRAVLGSWPWWAVLALYALVRFVLLDVETPEAPAEHGVGRALLSAAPTVARYLGWMAAPGDLSAYVQNPYVTRLDDPRLGLSLLILAGVAWLVLRLARSRPAAAPLGALLALSFAPILNLVRVAGPADMGAVMAERFAYLPSFPFVLLVALGAEAALSRIGAPRARRAIGAAALLAVAAPLAAMTVTRNRDWRDDLTLFRRETARTPDAPLLWTNLAGAWMRAGSPVEAERAIREAERLSPAAPWVIAVRAQWLTFAGRYEEALVLQERVVRLEGDGHALARNNLAFLYRMTGREERALEIVVDLVERLPSYPDPWLNLAEIERANGDVESAIASYRTVLDLRPGDLRAVEALAGLLAAQGEFAEAQETYLGALRGDASDARVWNNVAAVRLQSGDPSGALEAIERSLALDPASPRARFNRARLLSLVGRGDEASAILRELVGRPVSEEIRAAAEAELERQVSVGAERSDSMENRSP